VQTRSDDRFNTWWGPAVVCTGLEGDIDGSPAGEITRFRECVDLCVGAAASSVVSLAGGAPSAVQHDRSDHRVRRRAVSPAPSEREGSTHPSFIGGSAGISVLRWAESEARRRLISERRLSVPSAASTLFNV
jgi:hypothetical protein